MTPRVAKSPAQRTALSEIFGQVAAYDLDLANAISEGLMNRSIIFVVLGLSLLLACIVLGFSFLMPPFSQSVVIDSKGNTVGQLLDRDIVLRKVNGVNLALQINPTGFIVNPQATIVVVFESAECSGPQHIQIDADTVPPTGQIVTFLKNGKFVLVFPGGPVKQMTVKSYERIDSKGSSGCVVVDPARTANVGPIQVVDPTSWGFVPPFTVQ